MADAEALVTCENSMAVIIDVIEDEIESDEATENSHKATDSCHEGEPLSVDKGVKERKKTSEVWKYFKVDKSDNKKAICLTCEEKVSRGGSVSTKFNTSNLRYCYCY